MLTIKINSQRPNRTALRWVMNGVTVDSRNVATAKVTPAVVAEFVNACLSIKWDSFRGVRSVESVSVELL